MIADLQRLGFGNPSAFLEAMAKLDFEAAGKAIKNRDPSGHASARLGFIGKTIYRLLPYLEKYTETPEENQIGEVQIAGIRAAATFTAEEDLEVALPVDRKKFGIHTYAWFDATKRLHHKLLVTDNRYVMGGGRNIQDSYHTEFDIPFKEDHKDKLSNNLVFMDTDFVIDSYEIAEQALGTYNDYWKCGEIPSSCSNPFLVRQERLNIAESEINRLFNEMKNRAKIFSDQLSHQPKREVQRLVVNNSDTTITYLENKMTPSDNPFKKYLYEEPSELNRVWAELVAEAPEGSEVIFQNAYLYFPNSLLSAVQTALERGCKIKIITNSPASSDAGFVSKIARFQYKGLMKYAARHPGSIEILEYTTPEALHTKITVIGDQYLLIGASNADPRSEYLDTNNGILIENQDLVLKYKDWLSMITEALLKRNEMVKVDFDSVEKDQKDFLASFDSLPAAVRPIARKVFKKIQKITDRSFLNPDSNFRRRVRKKAQQFLDKVFCEI